MSLERMRMKPKKIFKEQKLHSFWSPFHFINPQNVLKTLRPYFSRRREFCSNKASLNFYLSENDLRLVTGISPREKKKDQVTLELRFNWPVSWSSATISNLSELASNKIQRPTVFLKRFLPFDSFRHGFFFEKSFLCKFIDFFLFLPKNIFFWFWVKPKIEKKVFLFSLKGHGGSIKENHQS